MDVVSYALLAYGLTAVISFVIIGLIVFVNNLISGRNNKANGEAK